jgi:WD40 repeat protein
MRIFHFHSFLLISLFVFPSLTVADDEPVSFHRDVLPIFRTNCIVCHKPGKARGGLDLTTHASLLKGGDEGLAVQAGDPDGSRLIQTVCGEEPEMPKDGEPLMPKETAVLRRWIAQGALSDDPVVSQTHRPAESPTYQSLPAVHSIAFSPDGTLLAIAGRHEIVLREVNGFGIVARLVGDSPRLESIAFSKDGSLIVASGGAVSEFGEIQIWETASRQLQRSIKASKDTFFGVSLSQDNRQVAVGCADKLVRVFNVADGSEAMRCDNHLDWVFGSAFTNDGLRLATVSRDKAAKLIDIATGRLIDDINQTRDPLICLTRHPVDDLVATGGTEGKIRLFRMEPRGGRLAEGDNKEESFVREFEHMGSPIQSVAFSPDGTTIACSALKGLIRLFKTENGQRLIEIKGTHGPVFALSFTADGKQIAAGCQDGRIRFYDTSSGGLVNEIDSVPVSTEKLLGKN